MLGAIIGFESYQISDCQTMREVAKSRRLILSGHWGVNGHPARIVRLSAKLMRALLGLNQDESLAL